MQKQPDRELLYSVTKDDCEWSITKGSGAGGQKRNKTSSAVHCFHRPSGAHGYSEASRNQRENKEDAFGKMARSKEFTKWNTLEGMKRIGTITMIEDEVAREMRKIKVEIQVDGKWVEATTENMKEYEGDANG